MGKTEILLFFIPQIFGVASIYSCWAEVSISSDGAHHRWRFLGRGRGTCGSRSNHGSPPGPLNQSPDKLQNAAGGWSSNESPNWVVAPAPSFPFFHLVLASKRFDDQPISFAEAVWSC